MRYFNISGPCNSIEHYMINASIRLKGVEEGLEQTARYVDICGCSKGWLAIFDCRSTVQWDDKIYMKKETVDGKTITTVGL